MKEETVQTLHPQKGKKNSPIASDKYTRVRSAILAILRTGHPTYTELLDQLKQQLEGQVDGSISWCTMTVKLDLEARGIIERSGSAPQRYRIKQA